MTPNPIVKAFFDEPTFTITYIAHNPDTKECAIIDSVLGFDPISGHTDKSPADLIINYIKENDLKTEWIMETHIHADHISAAPYLKEQLGGITTIGKEISVIQNAFSDIFCVEEEFPKDGRQFDRLLDEESVLSLGSIPGKILHTPGHTPACITIVFGNCAFVGDTIFMPDFGTARCDFPGGCATTLFKSIHKILSLPDHIRIFTGHDYKTAERDEYRWESSVKEQRETNIHIATKTAAEFQQIRDSRDAQIDLPKLIIPSVQINMRAGHMPPPEQNGHSYIKIPVDLL
ncbi:MBL fold metallo-hydrolase [Curvivirga sp.]|uniref:MBL fold metallo-hydrolase n=1 Tax=Curvivirga sp. TaxID=2856848 RepID=UPI003B58F1FF